jgi:hypothetical protein
MTFVKCNYLRLYLIYQKLEKINMILVGLLGVGLKAKSDPEE